jgi:hypothetical protein
VSAVLSRTLTSRGQAYKGWHFDVRVSGRILVELRGIAEHRRALAARKKMRLITRPILPDHGDAVVAIEIANPTTPGAY